MKTLRAFWEQLWGTKNEKLNWNTSKKYQITKWYLVKFKPEHFLTLFSTFGRCETSSYEKECIIRCLHFVYLFETQYRSLKNTSGSLGTKVYLDILKCDIKFLLSVSSCKSAKYIRAHFMIHKVVGSNPTRANFLYGIEKP